MHAFVTFLAAFLTMPARVIFRRKASDQQLTPERLIRMGAGN